MDKKRFLKQYQKKKKEEEEKEKVDEKSIEEMKSIVNFMNRGPS